LSLILTLTLILTLPLILFLILPMSQKGECDSPLHRTLTQAPRHQGAVHPEPTARAVGQVPNIQNPRAPALGIGAQIPQTALTCQHMETTMTPVLVAVSPGWIRMWYVTVLLIAIGLAMDAFAVSLGTGCGLKDRARPAQIIRMAGAFGLFQAVMPVIGWFGGRTLAGALAGFDHWIAMALLAGIGAKMIYEGVRGDACETGQRRDPTRGLVLLMLAIATSIDALAVGVSFGLTRSPIVVPAIIIGVVCAAFTAVGLVSGRRLGCAFGTRMEIVGGVVLVAIGVKIVVEHMVKSI